MHENEHDATKSMEYKQTLSTFCAAYFQYNANVIIIILICQHIDLSSKLRSSSSAALFATLMEHKLSSNVLCDQWQYQYKVEIISSSSSSSHSINGAACSMRRFCFDVRSDNVFFPCLQSERKFNFQMQTIFSFVIHLFYRVVLWDDVEEASSSSCSSKAINIDDRWRIQKEDEELLLWLSSSFPLEFFRIFRLF